VSHVVADQSEIFDFLADPATHGLFSPPKRIDTHGAVVFLAGENVYKVKRAVKFPFMDLSTLARRKSACEAEIEVNKPDAPGIYLGAVPIIRSAAGLRIGGDGEPAEWAVHMRRFDEDKTLDLVAERDGLPPALLAKLVMAILASHAHAPVRDGLAAAESLRSYLRQNSEAFAESPEFFPPERAAALTSRSEALLAGVLDLLLERGQAGFVRRCHGDLHLRNLVLIGGQPTLFDAVEFDDAIATGDVLYDLAFLLMDIWERGLKTEANLVLNRYLWGSGEAQLGGLGALPLFLSIRAAIRAKVTAASLPHLAEDARRSAASDAERYFAAAEAFVTPQAPRLIAVGGLSGSGKTTLAASIAPLVGQAPGAIHLRSDIERKVQAGVAETERLPPDTYTQAASDAVYSALRRKAKIVLAAGYSVVVDAVHARIAEREAIEAVASATGGPFSGLWLDAPLDTLVGRVRSRTGDASDATESVVRQQARLDVGDISWLRVDAWGDTAGRAMEALRLSR
jgi:aminoglycoside phosphotransferase family enzyme/predicted kinase